MSETSSPVNDFITFARQHGYELSDFKPDGKIHRFQHGNRDNGWYFAHLNFSERLKRNFVYGQIGDWKTGVKHEFRTELNGLEKTAREEIRARIEAQKKLHDDEKIAKQEQAAKEAEAMWFTAREDFLHPYMKRKGFDRMFGARVSQDGTLLTPMWSGGKLHGVQRIYEDGTKLYLTGQKFRGTYFQIGKNQTDKEIIYLCEGFSTACSIHLATGSSVICAYSASNLPAVAQQFIGYNIVIAADNDTWTEGNPGVQFAQKAAKILTARIVIPEFPPGSEGTPTDFNDMHNMLGLKAVKEALVGEEKNKIEMFSKGIQRDLEKEVDRLKHTITNFDSEYDAKTKKDVKFPREYAAIWDDVTRLFEGRIKRCGELPFYVQPSGEIKFFRSPGALFGFFMSKGYNVEWSDRLTGGISKTEFLNYVATVAENFELITALPHYPAVPSIFYSRTIAPQKTGALDRLVGMMNCATVEDQQLFKAMLMTPFWGGGGGQRPAFCLDGVEDDEKGNRGIGKTSATDTVAALSGDCIDLSNKTDGEEIRKRLLTSGDMRMVRMDNIKSSSLSNDVIESLITTKRISGHKMYVGHVSVNNWFTWVMTFNDAMMSKDFAQRMIIIRLKRPVYSPTWWTDVSDFIEKNREKILADIGYALLSESPVIKAFGRFPHWERGVLSKACTDFEKTMKAVEASRSAVDSDMSLSEDIEELIGGKIAKVWRPGMNYEKIYFDPEDCVVLLPRTWVYDEIRPLIDSKASRRYLARRFQHSKPAVFVNGEIIYCGDRYLLWVGRKLRKIVSAPQLSGSCTKGESGVPIASAWRISFMPNKVAVECHEFKKPIEAPCLAHLDTKRSLDEDQEEN